MDLDALYLQMDKENDQTIIDAVTSGVARKKVEKTSGQQKAKVVKGSNLKRDKTKREAAG